MKSLSTEGFIYECRAGMWVAISPRHDAGRNGCFIDVSKKQISLINCTNGYLTHDFLLKFRILSR